MKHLLSLLFVGLFLCGAANGQITRNAAPVDLASPGPIGGTTPAAVTATSLSFPANAFGTPGVVPLTNETAFTNGASGGNSLVIGGDGSGYNRLRGGLFSDTGFRAVTGGAFEFAPNYFTAGDLFLLRDSPGTLRLGGSATTSDTALLIPGLYTDASNYHMLSLAMTDIGAVISVPTLGTGVDDLDITLTPSGTGLLRSSAAIIVTGYIQTSLGIQIGSSTQLLFGADRTRLNAPVNGDLEIKNAADGNADTALILGSPDGTRYRVTVSNLGVLTATAAP